MLGRRLETAYDGVASPVVNTAGGFEVPKLTSYEVAPVDAHDIVTEDVDTPVAPLEGDGDEGMVGGGGGAAVVNDHTVPAVDPPLFFATTCQ